MLVTIKLSDPFSITKSEILRIISMTWSEANLHDYENILLDFPHYFERNANIGIILATECVLASDLYILFCFWSTFYLGGLIKDRIVCSQGSHYSAQSNVDAAGILMQKKRDESKYFTTVFASLHSLNYLAI